MNNTKVNELKTLDLISEFNNLNLDIKHSQEYLNSDKVRYYDAHNTFNKIKEVESKLHNSKCRLNDINNEIIFRVNNYGKQVNLYDKKGNIINSYALPKTTNENDNIGFILCKENNSYSIHNRDYELLKLEDIKDNRYSIDRNIDGSIKWNCNFDKYDSVFWYDKCGYSKNELDDNSYAIVRYNNKYGIINKQDEKIVPLEYTKISKFYNNFAKIEFNEKWAIINRKGEFISKFEYDSVEFIENLQNKENEPIIVSKDGKYGLINGQNKIILPLRYDGVDYLSNFGVIANINNQCEAYNFEGESILPLKYKNISIISKDLIEVIVDDKYGIYDKYGFELLPIEYNWIESFENGFAKVFKNKKYGLINANGELVLPVIYSFIDVLKNDMIRVRIDDKYGLFDGNGRCIVPVKYDSLSDSLSGLIRYTLNNKEGYLNQEGVEVNLK